MFSSSPLCSFSFTFLILASIDFDLPSDFDHCLRSKSATTKLARLHFPASRHLLYLHQHITINSLSWSRVKYTSLDGALGYNSHCPVPVVSSICRYSYTYGTGKHYIHISTPSHILAAILLSLLPLRKQLISLCPFRDTKPPSPESHWALPDPRFQEVTKEFSNTRVLRHSSHTYFGLYTDNERIDKETSSKEGTGGSCKRCQAESKSL